jgi:hypothetical protein
MPSFKVAHLREQGVDLVIIPLEGSFGLKSQSEQLQATGELQVRARSAGLAGTVVPVWDAGNGRMAFLANRNWHAFFESLDMSFVARNLNRQLYW